jgi:tRNA/rRNA methyltransferase
MNLAPVLDRLRVVLVETSHSGNIGSAARALKTMGLSRLYLVNPKSIASAQAQAMASGGGDVLTGAVHCASLDDALQGTTLAFAVTARRRGLSHTSLPVREAAIEAAVQARTAADVAFVFGTEMSGLSNEDVLKCQRIAHIPANPDYSSLNIAAAVQVVCYELRIAAGLAELPAAADFPLASFEEVERFYAHLERTLTDVRFLDPAHPKRLMTRLRRIFGRVRLEREEVQILRGVLKMISRAVRHDDSASRAAQK